MTDPKVAAAATEPTMLTREQFEEAVDALVVIVHNMGASLAGIARYRRAVLSAYDAALASSAGDGATEPYEAKPCRGHWHVYSAGAELAYGALDEEAARRVAAQLNAEWQVSKDKLEAENIELRRQLAGRAAGTRAENGDLGDEIMSLVGAYVGAVESRNASRTLADERLAEERIVDIQRQIRACIDRLAAARVSAPGSPTNAERVTDEDVLRLRGAIQFAKDMSGGQANTRGLEALADKLARISAGVSAGAAPSVTPTEITGEELARAKKDYDWTFDGMEHNSDQMRDSHTAALLAVLRNFAEHRAAARSRATPTPTEET